MTGGPIWLIQQEYKRIGQSGLENYKTTMRRRRSFTTSLIILLLLVFACLASLIIIGLGFEVLQQAEFAFGKPADTLGFRQKLLFSAQLLLARNDLNKSTNANIDEQDFIINQAESVTSVAVRLKEAGLIPNAEIFRIYLIYSGLDTGLQAGKFKLSPSSTPIGIAHKLQNFSPTEVEFNILPGWRAEEIAAVLPTSGLTISPADFMYAVEHPSIGIPVNNPTDGITSLEGFLMPGQYIFRRDISLNDMLLTILRNFDSRVPEELRQQFQAHNLSLYQAVTLASLIQREAMVSAEQPMIASVFYNRLEAGMKLDSDPTVQYVLGYNQDQRTWWTNPLTSKDLLLDSPYNTYLNPGFPPGPIANPGLSALQAVASPENSPYFYFRARCDSSKQHNFAVTLDEQIKNACR